MDQNLNGSNGGTMGLSKAGLAEGAAANTFKTANTFLFTVDGVVYSLAATDNLAFSSGHTALGNNQTSVFAVWVDASNNITTTQGDVVDNSALTADTKALKMPDIVDAKALVGLIKVKTDVATFTAGSTDLGATNVTDTYYDCSLMPSAPLV